MARDGDQVLGYACSRRYRDHEAYWETVKVSIPLDAGRRGQGVGTALYRALFDSPPLPRVNQTAPVPRRIRAVLNGRVVLDTTSALYVWESERYPQYYVPATDIDQAVLVDERHEQKLSRGTACRYGLAVGEVSRPTALRVYGDDASFGLVGRARFGTLLAESASLVLVFETGLPTRYYLNRTEVDFTYLTPADTVTGCPYKGTTSAYWAARVNGETHPDIAWSYDFPTRQLLPIAGLVAFYNEKVDIVLDGQMLARPTAPFS